MDRGDRSPRERPGERPGFTRSAEPGGKRPFERNGDRIAPVGPDTGAAPTATGLRAGPLVRWIGSFSLKRSLLVFFGFAFLGAVATLIMGSDPGTLLGLLIMAGSFISALCVVRRSLYVLLPLPALSYLVLAIVVGGIHDYRTATSTTQLGLSFLQWIGGGFFTIFAATLLLLLIFGARLLAARQLVSGSFSVSAQRQAAGPRPARRQGRTPWDDGDSSDEDPRDARGNRTRVSRNRDSREPGSNPRPRPGTSRDPGPNPRPQPGTARDGGPRPGTSRDNGPRPGTSRDPGPAPRGNRNPPPGRGGPSFSARDNQVRRNSRNGNW